jgi:hypothetical protein
MQDHAPLGKEAIWAVYQELRRLAPRLAAEAGTALYLPMLGCNDRVEGFGSARAQRHVRASLVDGDAWMGWDGVGWMGVGCSSALCVCVCRGEGEGVSVAIDDK